MSEPGVPTPETLLRGALFCVMMVLPLVAYQLGFRVFAPVFPFAPADFARDAQGLLTPQAAFLNAELIVFLCVGLLTVLVNLLALVICLGLAARLRRSLTGPHALFALLVWAVLLVALIGAFDLAERLSYTFAAAPAAEAFYALPRNFAFLYIAENVPELYAHRFGNGLSLADFVLMIDLLVLASFMPPLSLAVLCMAGAGFLPLDISQDAYQGKLDALAMRHKAIVQALYVMALLFFFVVIYPAASFRLVLAFPLEGAPGAVGSDHPLDRNMVAATLFVASSAVMALCAAYLPATVGLDLQRRRTTRAARRAGADDVTLAEVWLIPALRQNLAMISPIFIPAFNLLVT